MSAETPGGGRKWQCKHCAMEIPFLPLGVFLPSCPFCQMDVRDVFEESASPASSSMEETQRVSSGAAVPEVAGKQQSTSPAMVPKDEKEQGIPMAAPITVAHQSPPPVSGTGVDVMANKEANSAMSPATGLYPNLPSMEEMDISLGLCSQSDAAQPKKDDAPTVPQKRHHEDSQHSTGEKKKCGSENPSASSIAPSPPPKQNTSRDGHDKPVDQADGQGQNKITDNSHKGSTNNEGSARNDEQDNETYYDCQMGSYADAVSSNKNKAEKRAPGSQVRITGN